MKVIELSSGKLSLKQRSRRESLDGGESVDFKKLKSFKSTLQDKVLELKGMDQEVLEYLESMKM